MNMGINTSSGQNHFFSSNHISCCTHYHVGVDTSHHIGVTRLAYADNTVAFDADIGLDDTRYGIDNESVRNDDIQGIRR